MKMTMMMMMIIDTRFPHAEKRQCLVSHFDYIIMMHLGVSLLFWSHLFTEFMVSFSHPSLSVSHSQTIHKPIIIPTRNSHLPYLACVAMIFNGSQCGAHAFICVRKMTHFRINMLRRDGQQLLLSLQYYNTLLLFSGGDAHECANILTHRV